MNKSVKSTVRTLLQLLISLIIISFIPFFCFLLFIHFISNPFLFFSLPSPLGSFPLAHTHALNSTNLFKELISCFWLYERLSFTVRCYRKIIIILGDSFRKMPIFICWLYYCLFFKFNANSIKVLFHFNCWLYYNKLKICSYLFLLANILYHNILYYNNINLIIHTIIPNNIIFIIFIQDYYN